MGFEFKDGKQPAFKGENQKRFIRLRSLGEGYRKEEIQEVISGKNLHKSKGGSEMCIRDREAAFPVVKPVFITTGRRIILPRKRWTS